MPDAPGLPRPEAREFLAVPAPAVHPIALGSETLADGSPDEIAGTDDCDAGIALVHGQISHSWAPKCILFQDL